MGSHADHAVVRDPALRRAANALCAVARPQFARSRAMGICAQSRDTEFCARYKQQPIAPFTRQLPPNLL